MKASGPLYTVTICAARIFVRYLECSLSQLWQAKSKHPYYARGSVGIGALRLAAKPAAHSG